MSVNMRYALRSDDVSALGTWTVETGTEVEQYEASHLVDDVIAHPAKLVESSGAWVGDYTSRPTGKQRVDAVAIPMHNLIAGLSVKIQGNNANTWGTPTFSQAVTIPAYMDDGFPFGAWLDLTGLTGYDVAGFAYWRLFVEGANSAAVAAKLKLVAALQTLSPNINWGEVEDDERPIIEHQTDYRVSSVYNLGVSIRRRTGDLDSPDTQRDAIRALWRSTRGRAYPFLLIPNGDVNDAWVVRFADTKLQVQLNLIDRNAIRLGFEEVSRGLVL